MLTKSGAKLLDFGLAKSGPLMTSTSSVSQLADSPTAHKPLTEQGTILGTFQYMSPEQLEGQEADPRTDIFAFGAVLYEMATGRRAFQGKNKTSLIAAIVSSTPTPVSEIAPLTPPALDHVIRKCLAKDPEDRWQSIHDVADQLQWIGEAGSKAGEPAPVLARRKSKLRAAWALHAATAIVAAAATIGVVYATKEPPRVVRSSLLPPDKATFDPSSGAMVLSPDGRRIAFVALTEDRESLLWVRSLDALSAQPLAGTDRATFPFWSPDSRFIAFFSGGKLRKIDANGGPPQAICDAPNGRGGAWNDEGTILFTPTTTDAIFRVSSAGGTPVQLTTLDAARQEVSHRFPEFLPDGEHFLFLVEGSAVSGDPQSGFGLWIGSIDSSERTWLLETTSSARYSNEGYLLFLRDKSILAQRFNASALRLEGEAVPVAENVSRTVRWETMVSLSETNLMAFQAGVGSESSEIVLLDRDGKDLRAIGKPADYGPLSLSNDGRRVAVTIRDPQTQTQDIWVLDAERGTSTRLTFDADDDTAPLWSHDDRYVYFTSDRQGRGDVYRKASAGTGDDEIVLADPQYSSLRSLTADGMLGALITQNAGKTGWDISLLNMETGAAEAFLMTPFTEVLPALSPDGRWVAYHSNESGRFEVYVQRIGSEGGKWQISTDGGSMATWSRETREIIFSDPERKLMIVDVALEPTFSASVPRPWIDPRMKGILGRAYDVSADGSRVVVNRALDAQGVAPVTLVQNWTAGLQ